MKTRIREIKAKEEPDHVWEKDLSLLGRHPPTRLVTVLNFDKDTFFAPGTDSNRYTVQVKIVKGGTELGNGYTPYQRITATQGHWVY
jgi:hypothetical protein